jgi:TolA-binding protein
MMKMKHLISFSPRLRTALALLICLSIGAAVLIYAQRANAVDQDIQKFNRFMQTNKTNTASVQLLREGRDMIEAQNWQKAAEKFNDFIRSYPKDKDLDAALYWFGYALQKQGLK